MGQLTICDYDNVDLTNLQRQVIHTTQAIGLNKAVSAQQSLAAINPEITVVPVAGKSGDEQFTELARDADVVIDCSDNFRTRYTLNRICVALKKPLVSGAAIGFEGQVTVFDMRHDDSTLTRPGPPPLNEQSQRPSSLLVARKKKGAVSILANNCSGMRSHSNWLLRASVHSSGLPQRCCAASSPW